MVRRCLQGSRRFGMVGWFAAKSARRPSPPRRRHLRRRRPRRRSRRRSRRDPRTDPTTMTTVPRARSSRWGDVRRPSSPLPRFAAAGVRRRWRRVRDRRAPGTRRRSSPRPVSREAPRASVGRRGKTPAGRGTSSRAWNPWWTTRGGARRENSREGGARTRVPPSPPLPRPPRRDDARDARGSRRARGPRRRLGSPEMSSRGGSARLGDDGVTGRTRHRDASDVVGARRGSPRGAWVFGCGVVFHRVSVPAQLFTSIVQRRRG